MNDLKYSIEVYEDHAIINGWIDADVLKLLLVLCEKEGFKGIVSNEGKKGLKLVK